MSLRISTIRSQKGWFGKLLQILVGDNLSYIFSAINLFNYIRFDIINQLYLLNSLYLSKYLWIFIFIFILKDIWDILATEKSSPSPI